MVKLCDAKYVLSEIRNISYYEHRIAQAQEQLREIEQRIETATDPACPNGGTDVVINGRSFRVKVRGTGYDSGKAISDLITAQKPYEEVIRDFGKRLRIAMKYRSQLLENDETGFAKAFLTGGMSYKELERKFYVSNAYSKMTRLIMQHVKKV